jgi:flagellar motility protein MotE (MotC chaperone)
MTSVRGFLGIAIVMLGVAGLKLVDIAREGDAVPLFSTPAMAADAKEKKPEKKADKKEGNETKKAEKADDHAEDDAAPKELTPAEKAALEAYERYEESQKSHGSDFIMRSGLSRDELTVLSRLGERRETLDQREADIETQARLLEAAEKRLDQRVAKLEALQATIERLLGQLGEAEEAEVGRLVSIYEKMKPKSAAEIFSAMDEETLIGVASRMKDQSLSSIMAAMPTEKAVRLTATLAKRHRQPSTLDEINAQLDRN